MGSYPDKIYSDYHQHIKAKHGVLHVNLRRLRTQSAKLTGFWNIILDSKQKMYEARGAGLVAKEELRQIREEACVSIESDGMQMHMIC